MVRGQRPPPEPGITKMYILLFTAIFVTVVLLVQFYLKSTVLVNVQYPVNLTTRGVPKTFRSVPWHGVGPLDNLTIAFYALGLALVISFMDEQFVKLQSWPGVKLSDDKKLRISYCLILSSFFVVSLLHSYIVWINIPHSAAILWNGYPDEALPHALKLFYLVQIAFWLQCIPQSFNSIDEMNARIVSVAETVFGFTIVSASLYWTCLAPVTFYLLIVHDISQLAYRTADFLSYFQEYEQIVYVVACVHHMLAGIDKVLALVLSFLVYIYSPDVPTEMTRLTYLAGVLGWTFTSFAHFLGYDDGGHPGGLQSNQYGFPSHTKPKKRRAAA